MAKSRKSVLLRKKLKPESNNQRLIIALGLVVAVVASVGVYSTYAGSHAASTPGTFIGSQNWFKGTSQSPYNTVTVTACTFKRTGNANWIVRGYYTMKSGKGGSPRWYGYMYNPSSNNHFSQPIAPMPNTAPSTQMYAITVNSNVSNFIDFYWSIAGFNLNPAQTIRSGIRPAQLAPC